jgi:hypothetical protein
VLQLNLTSLVLFALYHLVIIYVIMEHVSPTSFPIACFCEEDEGWSASQLPWFLIMHGDKQRVTTT